MKTIIMIFFLILFNFYANSSNDFVVNRIELIVVNDTLYAVDLLDIADTVLPNYIFNIDPIWRLRIHNCNYKNLPLRIRDLVVLKEIDFFKCYNLDFNESIHRLRFNVNLTNLDLPGNKLSEVPSGIQYLVNLEELVLANNNLTSIPKSVFHLKKLKTLSLEGNQIREFEVGEKFNETISSLSLDRNELTSLPKGISKFKGLKYLWLNENDSLDFENVCDVVKDLPNLEILRIRNIIIDSIPLNINNLFKLKFLIINRYKMDDKLYNELKSILKNTRFM